MCGFVCVPHSVWQRKCRSIASILLLRIIINSFKLLSINYVYVAFIFRHDKWFTVDNRCEEEGEKYGPLNHFLVLVIDR